MPVSKQWSDFPSKINVTDSEITFPDGTSLVSAPRANTASYIRTTDGAQTLLAAKPYLRHVIILVKIVTTFAAGDGAAPVFDFGEADSTQKYKATLNSGSAGTYLTYGGTLSPGKTLLITATAATGTTSAGAIDVTVLSLPSS